MPEHTDDHDALDARLAGLASLPVPPLAGAAAARSRGAQRTRRTRGVLAGGGLLVVALAAGAAVAGTGGADRQTLPQATARATAPPSDPLTAALLDPQDLEATSVGRWVEAPVPEGYGPVLPEACPADTLPGDVPPGDVLRLLRGPDRTAVAHQVRLLADEEAAAAALGALIDTLEGCGEAAPTAQLVQGLPGSSTTRQYGVLVDAELSSPFVVEQVGAALTAVRLSTGGGVEDLPPLADAAAAEVRTTLGGATPQTSVGPAATTDRRVLAQAFLTPEEASAAEEPGWSVDAAATAGPGPVVDVCGEGTFPRADALQASDERRMSSTREAGGSELVQEVFRYSSPQTALQAHDGYVSSVARCPERPGGDGTVRSEVAAEARTSTGRRLLVRQVPCQTDGTCVEHFATYRLVVQSGDLLTAAAYVVGEDGDPEEGATALLDALATRLATAAGD